MNSLRNGFRAFATGIGAALVLAAPSVVEARTEVLRWTHPDGAAVANFNVYFGTASRAYGEPVAAGTPTPDSAGVYSFALEVPTSLEDEVLYIAVTADDGQGIESIYSNEKVRNPDGYVPPTPPPSGGGSAAVTGFVLWDASTDTVLDSNFQSGEQIALDVQGSCLAIEIVGNAYLQQWGSPGSLMYSFDGQTPSSCSNPPISHENDPPYAWEVEEGPGQFACAPSLTAVGTHTLTVTPYDGDTCTGTAGTSITLSFEVTDAAAPPAEIIPLGRPGRPALIE